MICLKILPLQDSKDRKVIMRISQEGGNFQFVVCKELDDDMTRRSKRPLFDDCVLSVDQPATMLVLF